MKKEHWLAGWTRIEEQEFKRVAAEAMRQNPQMHHDIRQAITISSARVGVPHETRDRYLTWLDEVERAALAMANAVLPQTWPGTGATISPVRSTVTALYGGTHV